MKVGRNKLEQLIKVLLDITEMKERGLYSDNEAYEELKIKYYEIIHMYTPRTLRAIATGRIIKTNKIA